MKKLIKKPKKVEKVKLVKKNNSIVKKSKSIQSEINSGYFDEIANNIKGKNMSKPYPDINNIPN